MSVVLLIVDLANPILCTLSSGLDFRHLGKRSSLNPKVLEDNVAANYFDGMG